MEFSTILGLVAGALTTSAMLPQVLKAARTGKTQDLSLPMFVMLDVGIFLWLAYGIIIGETPVIVANCAGLVLATTLIVLKVRFG